MKCSLLCHLWWLFLCADYWKFYINFILFCLLFIRELSLSLILLTIVFFWCVNIITKHTVLLNNYIILLKHFLLEFCVQIIEYCILNLYCSVFYSLKKKNKKTSIFHGVLTWSDCDATTTAKHMHQHSSTSA